MPNPSRSTIVYVAGPYRSDTESGLIDNIRHAEKYARKYWQLGYTVICPHLNTAHFGGLCDDEAFLEGTMEMLRRCDVVVMIPGWGVSRGSIAERDTAVRLGLEVIYEG